MEVATLAQNLVMVKLAICHRHVMLCSPSDRIEYCSRKIMKRRTRVWRNIHTHSQSKYGLETWRKFVNKFSVNKVVGDIA